MPFSTASPAAMPSEPPMKLKSCTAAVTGRPSSVPAPDEHSVVQTGLGLGVFQPVGVAALVAEFQRIDGHVRQAIVSYSPSSNSEARRAGAAMRMW